MPKPLFGEAGSGMHFHQRLERGGDNLFYSADGYASLSDEARWYIGGLLEHGAAVLAFTNPSTNSYRRLVPGFEAPVSAIFSAGNRSAAVRIPSYANKPDTARIEFRPPDATGKPVSQRSPCRCSRASTAYAAGSIPPNSVSGRSTRTSFRGPRNAAGPSRPCRARSSEALDGARARLGFPGRERRLLLAADRALDRQKARRGARGRDPHPSLRGGAVLRLVIRGPEGPRITGRLRGRQ